MDRNNEHAILTQQKFEFYLLGLVFTILGLSVQTSQFSSGVQSVFEITAWSALLVSGLAGLSRIEWIPVFYGLHSDQETEESFVHDAGQGRPVMSKSGELLQPADTQQRIETVKQRVAERTERMSRIERQHMAKYAIHKRLFVAGLVLLIASRAINLLSPPAGTAT
jgi:hypothetical protein